MTKLYTWWQSFVKNHLIDDDPNQNHYDRAYFKKEVLPDFRTEPDYEIYWLFLAVIMSMALIGFVVVANMFHV